MSTRFKFATSSLPFGFVGFVSQGSISKTLPAGVTILNADCPYQVSSVFAILSPKRKRMVEQNIFLSERRMRMAKTPEDYLAATDPRFAALIARSRRYDVTPSKSVRPFDALAESIAYQQLSGKAAATIWGRVRALYPKGKFLDPKIVLKTPDPKLRAAGLSRSKVAAIKDIGAEKNDRRGARA